MNEQCPSFPSSLPRPLSLPSTLKKSKSKWRPDQKNWENEERERGRERRVTDELRKIKKGGGGRKKLALRLLGS